VVLIALLCASSVYAAGETPPDMSGVSRLLSIAQARWRHETGHFVQVLPQVAPTLTPLPAYEQARAARLTRAEARLTTAAGLSPLPTPLPALTLVSPLPLPGALPVPPGVTVAVNCYTAPAGDGYEVVYEYSDAGVLWRMVENHGPEAWRARDWHALPAGISPLATPEAPQ